MVYKLKNNKKGSSWFVMVSIIIALSVLLVGAMPIISMAKQFIDKAEFNDALEQASKQFGNNDADFIPFQFSDIIEGDVIVQNSLDAFICAIKAQSKPTIPLNEVGCTGSTGKPSINIEGVLKTLLDIAKTVEKADINKYIQMTPINKHYDESGNYFIEVNIEGKTEKIPVIGIVKLRDESKYYFKVDMKWGLKNLLNKEDTYYLIPEITTKTAPATCKDDALYFGTSCVECTTKQNNIIPNNKNEAIDSIVRLLDNCWKEYSNSKKEILCNEIVSDIDISIKELDNFLSSNQNYKFDFGSSNDIKKATMVSFCFNYDIIGVNEVHVNNCNGITEKGNSYYSAISKESRMCTVKQFELPQDVNTKGTKEIGPNLASQFTGLWMGTYGAPKYVMYYEAMTQDEELIWKDGFGAVSNGAWVQAAALNGVLGAVGGVAKVGVKTSFKILTSPIKAAKGTVKAVLNLPKSGLKAFTGAYKGISSIFYRSALKSYFTSITKYGYKKALQVNLLKNAEEFENLRLLLGSDGLKSFIGSNKNPLDIDYALDILKSLKNSGKYLDDDALKYVDDLIKLEDEKFLLKYSKIDDLLTRYTSMGASKGASAFHTDLKSVLKGIEGISPSQQTAILKDLEATLKSSGIPNKPGFIKKILNKDAVKNFDDSVAKFSDELGNSFDEHLNIVPGKLEKLGFTGNAKKFIEDISETIKNNLDDNKILGIYNPQNKKTLFIKYYGGYLLNLIAYQREGLVDQFESAGANTLRVASPYILGPRPHDENISELNGKFLVLDKNRVGDTSVGKALPRFYLASPCMTDLEIIDTTCSCNLNKGFPVITTKSGLQPVNMDSLKEKTKENFEELNKKYMFDDSSSKLTAEERLKIQDDCMDAIRSNDDSNKITIGSSSLSDFSEACFYSSLFDSKLHEELFDYYVDYLLEIRGYFKKYLDTKKLANFQIDNNKGFSSFSSKLKLKNFFDDLDELVNPAKNLGLLRSSTKEGMQLDHIHTILLDCYDIVDLGLFNEFCDLTYNFLFDENNYINANTNLEIKEKMPCEDDSFCKEYDLGTCTNKICSKEYVGSEKEFFSASIDNFFIGNIKSIDEYEGLFYHFSNSIYKPLIIDYSNNEENAKTLSYKIAREYFFNYYDLTNNIEESKIIKSCDNFKFGSADSLVLNEFNNDQNVRTVTTSCVSVKPVDYKTYSPSFGTNYCFTDTEMTGWRGIAQEFNTYGWVAVDVAAGFTPAGPVGMMLMGVVTGAAQYGIDAWLVKGEKWPQHKGDTSMIKTIIDDTVGAIDNIINNPSEDSTISKRIQEN